jgi:hypothetical protein
MGSSVTFQLPCYASSITKRQFMAYGVCPQHPAINGDKGISAAAPLTACK